ncbi:MAG: tetratricopeptide repeat protein [Syntrophales bacterium]|nr:tetratricopeptide repeat protein [Syntrophales bacterium]MDY0044158.1 tetratricopeptide repeat protein [Syntrophales bacterium]
MNVKGVFYILLFAIICAGFFAEEAYCSNENNMKEQFGFAESLFDEGDYFRAISEYKRFIFLYPSEASLIEDARYKIALSYYKAGQWQQAIEEFIAFIEAFPESSILPEAWYLKGKAEYQLNLLHEALLSFERALGPGFPEFRNKVLFESALVLVELKEWEEAGKIFSRIPNQSIYGPSADKFLKGLRRIDHLPARSPVIAGALAAVLPGAGHVYTENYRDGAVAFILNGVFIWAAIELFDNGDDVAGGIVSFLELGWYSGNIYSAVSSAHKYNSRVEESFIEGLKRLNSISFLHDTHCDRTYLAFNIEF